jgi:general secretion pathway protein M
MSDNIVLWWRARSPREQRLLIVMIALAALLLGWLLVVRPLGDALDAAKTRHGEAVVALAEARARSEARSRNADVPRPALPVDGLIGQSAGEAGFTGARITAQGPARASVALEAARPQALFGWVAGLERRGLVVERLRAQANADRTLSAEIVLRARSG